MVWQQRGTHIVEKGNKQATWGLMWCSIKSLIPLHQRIVGNWIVWWCGRFKLVQQIYFKWKARWRYFVCTWEFKVIGYIVWEAYLHQNPWLFYFEVGASIFGIAKQHVLKSLVFNIVKLIRLLIDNYFRSYKKVKFGDWWWFVHANKSSTRGLNIA